MSSLVMPDWVRWLDRYDRPRSPLQQRLSTVRRLVSNELDRTAPQAVSVLSICAGDGRDILEVLADRDDAFRVQATLLELEAQLCLLARARARRHGLGGVEVRRVDAGTSDAYVDLPAADLVILVGVFGNMEEAYARSTIAALSSFCRRGALVVWGRRNESDPIAGLRDLFATAGFEEAYASRVDAVYHVGAHRLARDPLPLAAGHRFFAFSNGGAGGRPRKDGPA